MSRDNEGRPLGLNDALLDLGERTRDLGLTGDPVVEAWGERVVLDSVTDFDRWVTARCESSNGSGRADAVRMADLAQRLALALPRLVARPEQVDGVLESLQRVGYPGDSQWALLLGALSALPEPYNPFKLLALARYRRYLMFQSSRREKLSPHADPAHARIPTGDHLTVAQLEERVPSKRPDDARRLVHGERTALDASRVTLPMEVWLASRRFTIEPGPRARVVDEHGRGGPLRDGRNLVGRALYAEVVVDESYADVSRCHVVVDVEEGRVRALTDVSSRGTFVSEKVTGAARRP